MDDKDREIARLKEQIEILQSQLRIQSQLTPSRPVIASTKVSGIYRQELISFDTLVCFYDPTGQNASHIIYDGLLRNGIKADIISYSNSDFDSSHFEQKVATAKTVLLILSLDSLNHCAAVFLIDCCSAYNIPIISVHDLSSCIFPNPSLQAQQIQDSNLFQEKAITYVKNYFDVVLETIIKQINTALKKRNFCLCYHSTITPESLSSAISQLQSTKFSRLLIQSDDISPSNYYHHVLHTINSCTSCIFILDSSFANSKNFICLVAKLATIAKTRVYCIESNPLSLLLSQQISTHKLSGIEWKTDGLQITPIEDKIQVEATTKFCDVLFFVPVSTGKWYYEVELLTECSSTQIGWANKNMDIHVEASGVGDDSHSYSYDGSRSTIFPRKVYGKPWKHGDVIGCMIDMDGQTISWSQNGEFLGIAFENFREKDENGNFLDYFPGMSVQAGQKAMVHFGGVKYIPQGYKPIEEAVPLKVASMPEILKIESCYSNYNVHIPRTRAFLSHKRSSAQGVAGRIWQELKNDYEIFLDSEAQFDLHDLKLIAKHTGLFVFILSEGIFDSYWCLEELRSAIRNNRKILVLQDFQFKIPTSFPEELSDIATFLETADILLYMAEFFSECIKQIRKRLGLTDLTLKEYLETLSPITKQAILDNSFGVSTTSFQFLKPIPISLSTFLEILENYYECTSLGNVISFHECVSIRPKVPITDLDMEIFTSTFPKLQDVILFALPTFFSDKSSHLLSERCKNTQIIQLYSLDSSLTDKTLISWSNMAQLRRITIFGYDKITDNGIKAISSLPIEALTITMDKLLTDEALISLPSSIRYLTLWSSNFTVDGVIHAVTQMSGLDSLSLIGFDVTDECMIEILMNCGSIRNMNMPATKSLTDNGLNTVPLPDSFTRLIVSKESKPRIPRGSKLVVYHPK